MSEEASARVPRVERSPRRRRARLASVAALAAVLLGGSVATPGPLPALAASAGPGGVKALTPKTATFAPGQSGWVSVVWRAQETVTDWQTRVTDAPEGVAVTYPDNIHGNDADPHTSLYGSQTLVGRTRDFTAFRLSVPYSQTSSFEVTLTSTYRLAEPDEGGEAETLTAVETIRVPVEPVTGPAFTQETSRLAMETDRPGWAQITFAGGPGDLAGFEVMLGDLPQGLAVTYPGGGSRTELYGGDILYAGTRDHVAVYLDASELPAGTYTIPFTIEYRTATDQIDTGSVILDVT